MPYIEQLRRQELESGEDTPANAGELNYLVTRLVLSFLGDQPHCADFNNAIGALECAKLELYRRMIAPYEDQKIAETGDVYPARGDDSTRPPAWADDATPLLVYEDENAPRADRPKE